MRNPVLILVSALVAIAAISFVLINGDDGPASAGGSMELMALDMDPTSNTATSIGARDECVEIGAEFVTIDVTALNIPEATAMSVNFAYRLTYDHLNLVVDSADHNFLINSPGSSLFDASEPLPDATTMQFPEEGAWTVNVVDTAGVAEFGSGVLSRITINASDAAPGVYALNLDGAAHIDAGNNVWPAPTVGGRLAVGGATCEGPTSTPFQQTEAPTDPPLGTVVPTPVPTAPPAPELTDTPTPTPTPTPSPTPTATPTLAPGETEAPTLPPGVTEAPTLAPGVTETPTPVPTDGDSDGDGIDDPVDSDPLAASDDFSDQPSGTTFGSIIVRGGLTVLVSDEADPQGVRIEATGAGGPATVSVCGLTNLSLDTGDVVIVTCSSANIQVLIGPVELTFGGATVEVPGGQTVTITEVSPGVFEILADADNTEDVIVDGVPLAPGDELTVSTETPTPATLPDSGASPGGSDFAITLLLAGAGLLAAGLALGGRSAFRKLRRDM